MSNVLIGIIGVILFIGLALAGALFLGPRFQESSSNAEAAASVAAIQQVVSAVELIRTENGTTTIRNGLLTTLPSGYLKDPVTNPSKAGRKNPTSYLHSIHFNNDVLNDAGDEGGTGTARYVMMAIGSDAGAKATCQAIARQFGQPELKIVNADDRYPEEAIGCRDGSGQYVVFAKI
jgi:hypothetical protein